MILIRLGKWLFECIFSSLWTSFQYLRFDGFVSFCVYMWVIVFPVFTESLLIICLYWLILFSIGTCKLKYRTGKKMWKTPQRTMNTAQQWIHPLRSKRNIIGFLNTNSVESPIREKKIDIISHDFPVWFVMIGGEKRINNRLIRRKVALHLGQWSYINSMVIKHRSYIMTDNFVFSCNMRNDYRAW